ncbi:hypothetical protein [Helicobacter rodentium]|nr:hypothetical protein [Helicobacter rodentium]
MTETYHCVIARDLLESRGVRCVSNSPALAQIYNLAHLRDSIANTSARFHIIDCHDFLRSLAMTQSYQTCHCERSEAIHNYA